jgi:hypothetical protein
MADMKKVYDDLTIINLYVLIFFFLFFCEIYDGHIMTRRFMTKEDLIEKCWVPKYRIEMSTSTFFKII